MSSPSAIGMALSAYRWTFRNIGAFFVANWGLVAVLLVLHTVAYSSDMYMGGTMHTSYQELDARTAMHMMENISIGQVLLSLALMAVESWLMIVLAVRVINAAINDDDYQGSDVTLFDRRVWSYMWAMFLVFLCVGGVLAVGSVATAILAAVFEGSPAMPLIVVVPTATVVVLVMVKLSVLFVLVRGALGLGTSLREAARISRGMRFKLLLAGITVLVPIILFGFFLAFAQLPLVALGTVGETILAAVGIVFGLVLTILFDALLAKVYSVAEARAQEAGVLGQDAGVL